jgi:anti-sigma B factor antagonist
VIPSVGLPPCCAKTIDRFGRRDLISRPAHRNIDSVPQNCDNRAAQEITVDNELLITPYKDVTVVNFQNVSVLDSANIEALGRSLLDLVEKNDTRKLILEFTAVRFMSSQALGVLLQLKKAMDPVHGKIVIAGIRPELHKVFKITNLNKMFTFHNDLDTALQEFNIFMPKS